MMFRFFQSKKNRDILGFFAGGVVALATAGWALFTYLVPSPNSADKVQQTQEGSCGVIAGGSITAQSIVLTCIPTTDEIKQIVNATSSGAEIVAMLQRVHSDDNEYQDQINVLAGKLNLVAEDVQGILLALNQTALPTDQAVDQFASLAAHYITIKDEYQQISNSGNLTQPESEAILSALQSGNLGLAMTLLAIAQQSSSNVSATGNDSSKINECDGGSLPYGPIQNATFAQSQITRSQNDFSDNWPSINLAGLDYRDSGDPFFILVNTRYRAFVPASADTQYFTFSVPEGENTAELQIRTTEDIQPHILIADAITNATVLKGRFDGNYDAVDFKPSATRYKLTISFNSSDEAKNYCFAVTTVDTGYIDDHFNPD